MAGLANDQAADPLPEGRTGIAARSPNDADLRDDPAALFAYDFENNATANVLRRAWDELFHDDTIRITEEPEKVHQGRKALELDSPRRAGDKL
jgi:hypothetical protein